MRHAISKPEKQNNLFILFNANFLFSIEHNRISKESHLEVKMIEQVIDFEVAREAMVECQVLPGGVRNNKLCRVLKSIPREAYVPEKYKNLAYMDKNIPLTGGREVLNPLVLSMLVELASIQPDDLVLDIGCGLGYSTAVLAALAGTVVALESDPAFVESANTVLQNQNIDNAVVVEGNNAEGQPKQGPFNVIFIGGMVDEVPHSLLEQLDENGRLVCVSIYDNASRGIIISRHGDSFSVNAALDVTAPKMLGFEKEEQFSF
jgi:protein-L-isoaspartate(D-aspartate) O-methyltransferase